ncbi:unnamed protein product [Mytilus coruscus]|uniref:Uncharacterized protein n=1 Tax=Mytilus coruscus TaxID=42192 RepID=A0A6J8AVB8_MYTCO|nr:unnamed protein product [Mytilus coruscus]
MYFDDTIDELTKQIQDMEEGTMYRNSFVSSTPKDQGVRPKDAFITRMIRVWDQEGPHCQEREIIKKEGDTLLLPKCIDNSYVREKDKIKPCKYDGSTPWMDYLSHFEMCALVNNWSENQKGLYLVVSLMGQPQVVLGDLPSEKRQKFSDLVSALEERFAPSSQTELYRVQFKERRQKASESLPELGQSIRRLSNLAYPTAPLDVRETLGKEQLIEALVDSEMQLRIKQS